MRRVLGKSGWALLVSPFIPGGFPNDNCTSATPCVLWTDSVLAHVEHVGQVCVFPNAQQMYSGGSRS